MKIEVTGNDRLAVALALGMDAQLMATWIATGSDPGVNYDTESRLAQMLARVRVAAELRGETRGLRSELPRDNRVARIVELEAQLREVEQS